MTVKNHVYHVAAMTVKNHVYHVAVMTVKNHVYHVAAMTVKNHVYHVAAMTVNVMKVRMMSTASLYLLIQQQPPQVLKKVLCKLCQLHTFYKEARKFNTFLNT